MRKPQAIHYLLTIVFPLLQLSAVNAQVDMPVINPYPEMSASSQFEREIEAAGMMSDMNPSYFLPNPAQTMLDNLWFMGGGDITRRGYRPDVEPARDEFLNEFRNMLSHLAEAKQDQALQSLHTLASFPSPNEYETALLAVGEVSLVPKDADLESFLHKLVVLDRHSTSSAGVAMFPEDFLSPYLRVAFTVAIQLNYYGEALKFHESLRGMKDKSLVRDLAETYEQVMAVANDDSTYGVRAMLGDSGKWELLLLKSNFYLDEVEGVLHGFEMICDDKKARLQAEELISYSVPQGQAGCQARVVGNAGTRFALVQF